MKISYGAWKLGGHGWGHIDQQRAIKALETAVESGISFFDTAPVYGFGQSERLLGQVVGKIKHIEIASKCGLVWDDSNRILHKLSKDSIRQELESSLSRLGRDYIDLYQIHWPAEDASLDEAISTLVELKQEGLIRKIGVCNYDVHTLQMSKKMNNVEALQYKYNFLERDVEKEILPYCEVNKKSFIAYSPLAQGFLVHSNRDFRPGKKDVRRWNPFFTQESIRNNAIEKLNQLSQSSLNASLLFLLNNDTVSRILISSINPEHIMENIRLEKDLNS